MPVSGGLPVNGAAEVKISDDGFGTEIKVLINQVDMVLSGTLPVPKVSQEMDSGWATPMT